MTVNYPLQINLKEYGEDHVNVGISYNNLANIYREKRQFKKAKLFYKKSHSIFLKTLGEQHPNTCFLLNKIKDLE